MKVLVLGNSNTHASYLRAGELEWPALVAREWETRLSEPVECENVTFMPMGSRAVPYARKLVDETDPELIIVPLVIFHCAVGWVSLRVRQRFGDRAFRWYGAVERRLTRPHAPRGASSSRPRTYARRALRRLIGTATHATVDDVIATYTQLLHELARDEGRHVLVVGESHYGSHIRRDNPELLTILDRVERAVRPVIAHHRFLWTDVHPAYDDGPGTDARHVADGVHANGVGHRIFAETVTEALEPLLTDRRS